MNNATIDFYDKESSVYTEKRYPDKAVSYTQYLFKKRLSILIDFLRDIKERLPANPKILDIGCADGVTFKAIEKEFPNFFGEMIGIDVSPKMIEEATRQNTNNRARFILRDNLYDTEFDVIMEIGVHPYNLDGELRYAHDKLKAGGYFFYDLVGKNAFFTKIKLKNKSFVKDYKTYKQYEEHINRLFKLEKSKVYGLFVPKLWSVPFIGRPLQSAIDAILRNLIPERFHEKVYQLRK